MQTLTIDTDGNGVLNAADEQIVFFNVQPATTAATVVDDAIGSGEPDLTEAQLEGSPASYPFITGPALNVSTSGIGLGNNNLNGSGAGISAADESFVVNPETLLTAVRVFIDNSVGGYSNAPGGAEELYYRVFYSDGTATAQMLVTNAMLEAAPGGQESFTIEAETGKLIDAVQLTMGNGVIKIPVIEFVSSTENLASDVKLDFSATLTDADGDSATSAFAADLFANELAGSLIDYTLIGTAADADAFNIDLPADEDVYRVEGFDSGDKIVLLGDAGATVAINTAGTDSIVTITESGGAGTTTVTVVGVDLQPTDVVFGT